MLVILVSGHGHLTIDSSAFLFSRFSRKISSTAFSTASTFRLTIWASSTSFSRGATSALFSRPAARERVNLLRSFNARSDMDRNSSDAALRSLRLEVQDCRCGAGPNTSDQSMSGMAKERESFSLDAKLSCKSRILIFWQQPTLALVKNC